MNIQDASIYQLVRRARKPLLGIAADMEYTRRINAAAQNPASRCSLPKKKQREMGLLSPLCKICFKPEVPELESRFAPRCKCNL